MGKFTQRTTGAIKADIQKLEVVSVRDIQAPVVMFLNEAPEVKNIGEPAIQYIHKEIEVIKEVPVEVIKFIDREVKVVVEVPVYITKEIEKIVEKPVEIIHNIDRKIVTFVDKTPNWCWLALGMELLTIILLIIK